MLALQPAYRFSVASYSDPLDEDGGDFLPFRGEKKRRQKTGR
jgi:hypothetical protein